MAIGWIFKYLKTAGYGKSLPNFHQVTPTLYRGGLPNPDGYRKLKAMGIESVINLIDGDQVREMEKAADAGLDWLHIPMSDKARPSDIDMRQILRFLSLSEGDEGEKLFIHCKGGRHRTGLIVALYRVVFEDWSKKDAWKEAEKCGFYSELGHGALREFFFDVDTETL